MLQERQVLLVKVPQVLLDQRAQLVLVLLELLVLLVLPDFKVLPEQAQLVLQVLLV